MYSRFERICVIELQISIGSWSLHLRLCRKESIQNIYQECLAV